MEKSSPGQDKADLAARVRSVLTVSDALFFKRLVVEPNLRDSVSKVNMSISPMLSAFVLDSSEWMREAGVEPENLDALGNMLTASRQQLKILDDRQRGSLDIIRRAEQVASIQQGWYRGSHSGLLGSLKNFIQPDLGLTFIGDSLFSTTDLALMSIGITPDLYSEESLSPDTIGAHLSSTSYHIGAHVQQVINLILPDGEPLIEASLPIMDRLQYRDVKADRFYQDLITPRRTASRGFDLLFTWILGQINTARFVVPVIGAGNPVATFKMRFVCLYHALDTIAQVLELHRQSVRLGPRAVSVLSGISSHAPSQEVLKERRLRNVLMHYCVRGAPVSMLSESRPLLGVVEAHAPGKTLESIRGDVDRGLVVASEQLQSLLPHWVRPRSNFD